jgi:uncharacterized protein YdeI (YjbR/CyaY-like superfamily)
METKWLIIILGIIAELTIIVFFAKRILKDKKDFMRKLTKNIEASNQKVKL